MNITLGRVRTLHKGSKKNLGIVPRRAGLAAARVTTGLQGEPSRLTPGPVQRAKLRSPSADLLRRTAERAPGCLSQSRYGGRRHLPGRPAPSLADALAPVVVPIGLLVL